MISEVLRWLEWIIRRDILHQDSYVAEVMGFKMCLDLKTDGISRYLAIHRIREIDTTTIFREELRQGMRVLDLGANIGYFSLLAANIVGRSGKVYAFEPDPRNARILRKSMDVNPHIGDIIEVHEMAASNTVGQADISLAYASNLTSMADRLKPGMLFEKCSIRTTTVDEFLGTRGGTINFIKMDIQGYEVEALEGMKQTLKNSPFPCTILFEPHPDVYNHTDRDLGKQLEYLYSMSFRPRIVVSAGSVIPEAFGRLGYKPTRIMERGKVRRHLFENVSHDDFIMFVSNYPRLVDLAMLSKQ